MALIKMYYFLAIACLNFYGIRAFTKEAGLAWDIAMEQRLTPIKSIELNYAIFDCVDIYKQPAFNHPLLKNHKIQMKPFSWHDMSNKADNSPSSEKRLNKFGQHLDCPDGTVPIRRSTKKSIVKGKSLRIIQSQPHNNGNPNERFAILKINQDKRYKVTGAKANIDIQNPQCNEGEASGALIWLFTETTDGKDIEDSISAGWMVDPGEYGNSTTHLEIQWTSKGGGCINLFCPGFIQISKSSPPGLLLTNISKYGGPLYTLPIWIYQDNVTKNWWVVTGTEHVGYWPKELFSTFDDGARILTYGGYTKSKPNQSSPPMGSGYTEKCNYNHTSFFCKLEYQITDQVLKGMYIPPRTRKTTKLLHSPCKNYVSRYSCKDSQELGYYFLYGGARGNCP